MREDPEDYGKEIIISRRLFAAGYHVSVWLIRAYYNRISRQTQPASWVDLV